MQSRILRVACLGRVATNSAAIFRKSSVASFSIGTDAVSVAALKERALTKHPKNNIPGSIVEKLGRNLHHMQDHPLNVIKQRVEHFCQSYAAEHYQEQSTKQFDLFDSLSPIVTPQRCFDHLLVKPDHVSRSPSDTYYLSDEHLLRTHTSAHQTELMQSGSELFLCSGDVYRRDEIDSSHYPVFHQMEGVKIFPANTLVVGDSKKSDEIIEKDLKRLLTGLAVHLFGDVEMRWNDDYFPFTHTSFELEVYFEGEWLEVLGCGVMEHEVLKNGGKEGERGWAFGLGLERLAMILFKIPDIRLFWTLDERFHKQFVGLSSDPSKLITFVPYSKFPPCYKDVSFWLPEDESFHLNDFYEVIRDVAGDLVEKVDLFDEFTHKKTKRKSQAWRINYRHMDRSLTNAEIDEVQFNLRDKLVEKLKIELR